MNKVFKQRLTDHVIELAKYFKYVFNDFFVIALMFFVGGAGYEYSQFLKTLKPGLVWERPVAIIVLLVVVQFCGLATFVKKADKVFLSPREYQFSSFFNRAFIYSYTMSALLDILAWFVLLPFISVSLGWKWPNLISLLLIILAIKLGWMAYQLTKLFYDTNSNFLFSGLIEWFIPFLLVLGTFYWNIWWTLGLSLVFSIIMIAVAIRSEKHLLDWHYTILKEDTRMNRIYLFFSLFTEVPSLSGKVHRHKLLDPIFTLIKQDQNHLYSNLFWRALVRDSGPSGLIFRLLVIGLVLIATISNGIISGAISLIFIYLIGFQLVPYFDHFDNNVFVHIYPVNQSFKLTNYRKVIQFILTVIGIAFICGMLLSGKSLLVVGFSVVSWIVVGYLLTGPYLKIKFKKAEME